MKLINLIAILLVSCTTSNITKTKLEIVFKQGVAQENSKRKDTASPYSETDWHKIIMVIKKKYRYSLYLGTVIFADSKYYYMYPFRKMGFFSLPKVPTDDELVIKKSIKLTDQDIRFILENN